MYSYLKIKSSIFKSGNKSNRN